MEYNEKQEILNRLDYLVSIGVSKTQLAKEIGLNIQALKPCRIRFLKKEKIEIIFNLPKSTIDKLIELTKLSIKNRSLKIKAANLGLKKGKYSGDWTSDGTLDKRAREIEVCRKKEKDDFSFYQCSCPNNGTYNFV